MKILSITHSINRLFYNWTILLLLPLLLTCLSGGMTPVATADETEIVDELESTVTPDETTTTDVPDSTDSGFETETDSTLIREIIKALPAAELVFGLRFTKSERDSMAFILANRVGLYQQMREIPLANHVPPAISFNPEPVGWQPGRAAIGRRSQAQSNTTSMRPEILNDLAFAPLAILSELIRTRQVSSLELTQMYLSRLKKYDPKLLCVISLTQELALAQAQAADDEIAAGRYRGPLHGIPYGVKDLLAVPPYPTTWGAAPYQHQVIEETATVVRKLEDSGAVLVAKLSLGALAWGDVWFGGMTRNPWNSEQGASGSSAGPASATAAGLVGFSIGTETWGSIVSPCTRCGATGLRPTYGRVSRAGAMALSWTMDKIGPICRTVQGCATVFEVIHGPDGIDLTIEEIPFNYPPDIDLSQLRIGYTADLFELDYPDKENDLASLDKLREMNCQLIPIHLPDLPLDPLGIILEVEAAAAFDELTRSNRDDELVRQIQWAWPNVFRAARFIPAVEYIQANRIRTLLCEQMSTLPEAVDLYVAPSFGGGNLLLTNLTGHPCVVVPNGFNENHEPTSISFIGNLFGEAILLAAAQAYQEAAGFSAITPSACP